MQQHGDQSPSRTVVLVAVLIALLPLEIRMIQQIHISSDVLFVVGSFVIPIGLIALHDYLRPPILYRMPNDPPPPPKVRVVDGCDCGFCTKRRLEDKQKTPIHRAQELLLAHLDDEQKERYLSRGSFFITGSDGQVYEICNDGYPGNVHLIQAGQRYKGFCGYPVMPPYRDRMVMQDQMLGQKLLIESDAAEYRRIAY